MLRSVDQESATRLYAYFGWCVVVFSWIYSLLLYVANGTRAVLLVRSGSLRPLPAFLHVASSLPLVGCVLIEAPWRWEPSDSTWRLLLTVAPIILLVSLVIQWRWLRQRERTEPPAPPL